MTTGVETFNSERQAWERRSPLKPGEKAGFCFPADSGSVIVRAIPLQQRTIIFEYGKGKDKAGKPFLIYIKTAHELRPGENYEFTQYPAGSKTPQSGVRLTHL